MKLKPIDPQMNRSKVLSGEIDLFYEKSGTKISKANKTADIWQQSSLDNNKLFDPNSSDELNLAPAYAIGQSVILMDKLWVTISKAKLIRLEDVTEEDAIRSGVERTDLGWKHYCPEKMFPTKVLKMQEPGHPYMTDARASYFTKWVNKYGHLDVVLNPWIWKYEFTVDLEKTFP